MENTRIWFLIINSHNILLRKESMMHWTEFISKCGSSHPVEWHPQKTRPEAVNQCFRADTTVHSWLGKCASKFQFISAFFKMISDIMWVHLLWCLITRILSLDYKCLTLTKKTFLSMKWVLGHGLVLRFFSLSPVFLWAISYQPIFETVHFVNFIHWVL